SKRKARRDVDRFHHRDAWVHEKGVGLWGAEVGREHPQRVARLNVRRPDDVVSTPRAGKALPQLESLVAAEGDRAPSLPSLLAPDQARPRAHGRQLSALRVAFQISVLADYRHDRRR